jgi:O-antigen/teichoic acid export membrane protein
MSSVNVLRLLVQFLSVPILARLLSPQDYGLAAMAMPVILFVMMLADAGFGSSLVRTGKTDEPAWHTCFWLSIGLGSSFAIGIALVSPMVGVLLNEPRLTPIILALTVIIPLQTFTLVPGAALQQQGRFGIIASTEIAAMVASIGAAIVLGIEGFGVWALVWQQLVFYSIRLWLTLVRSSYRPRMVFDLKDAWGHVVFGRNLLGASLITFISRSLENLTIGKIYGPDPVGIYSMAFQFARLPFMLVTGPLQYVLYPHVAAIREDKTRLANLFLLLTRVLAIVCLPSVGLVAVASEPIFHLLLSQKWGQAAPIFVLIAPAAALQPVTAILGTFLMALGRTDVQMRLAAQFAAIWLAGLMISVWYGIEAVAAAYTVCTVLFSLWSLLVCLPFVNCSLNSYRKALLRPIVLTAFAASAYSIFRFTTPDNELLNIFLAIALEIIVIAISIITERRSIIDFLTLSHTLR